MERRYDPALIWAYLRRWADLEGPRAAAGRMQLFVYTTERGGAYYMHGPKLYHDPVLGDGYFANVEPDALEQDANTGRLAEVLVYGATANGNDDPRMWDSWEDFAEEIGLPSDVIV